VVTRAPSDRGKLRETPEGPLRSEPVEVTPEGERAPRKRRHGWVLAATSVRAKILAVVILLLAASAVLSTFVIRQLLLIRLHDRVEDAGQQEVLELDRLLAVGRDPETGEPFESPRALFDAYLARNVPSSEEALLTFVDGQFYRSALGRFPLDRLPGEPIRDWEDLSSRRPEEPESVTGTFDTELGTAHFRVRRVVLGESAGAFVVAILPAAELEEIGDLQTSGVGVILGVLLLAGGIAWLVAGRVLSPVALLAETARSISRSDLTQRVEIRGTGEAEDMARSFNSMLDRLEAVFEGEREFVADASHELRDPLTICRGHLELLGDDPEERKETIKLVLDELDRMGRIVDQLQTLAETEQPNVLEVDWVDSELFAHELIAKAGALAPRKWTLDRSAQGFLLCDRARLTEAVMNLAHNAVQHTTEEDTIAIGVSLEARTARIWVRDTGTGIARPDQQRIFERFTRGSGSHRRYRGGGLGLAIVKALAEAHGGRVELESRLGEGSTFTIVLPHSQDEGASRV
jgi:two-component system, OmpR family, sensor kinase